MKAKSWKKFVKEDPEEKKKKFSFESDEDDSTQEDGEEKSIEEKDKVLKKVLEENETLSTLVKEREELEAQMAKLTGQDVGGDSGNRPFYFAEIASINEKKEAEKKREERRKRDLDLLKKRRELGKLSIDKPGLNSLPEARSNLSPIAQNEVISGTKGTGKLAKKEDDSNVLKSKRKKAGEKEEEERFDFEKNKRKKKEDRFSFKRNKKENERFSFEKNRKENERFDFDKNLKKQQSEGNRFSHEEASKARRKKREEADFFSKDKKAKDKKETDFLGRKKEGSKRLDDYFGSKKKEVDEWLIKDEKKREKAKKTLKDLRKFGSELQQKKKQLDKLNRLASDERFADAFDDDLKKGLSTASNITDKITKPFDAIKQNKAAKKFTDGWEQAKKKRIDANKIKEKYEKSSSKMLKVNVGDFGAMQLRLDKLKKKALRDKKAKKEEEEKELSKREQRKKEREEERKRERAEEKKREKKEEERREKKREERRRRKKDND